jgi:hypothetical protein
MRFSVDGWDPTYGSATEIEELPESSVQVDATIEVPAGKWAPVPPSASTHVPNAVLFVDGVRRIDARVWIDDDRPDGDSAVSVTVAGICASYGAGLVCCCGQGAHHVGTEVRRGLFTAAASATHIGTTAGRYTLNRSMPQPNQTAAVSLSNSLQRALTDLEITVAVEARASGADHGAGEDDLLVVDGPLRGRAHLPRALGYVKTHQIQYLPSAVNAVVAALGTGERTPMFTIGTGWERYSWYLRLPCLPGGPWTGIVRIEAAPTLDVADAVTLANMSQALLGRFASVEYKDGRAPQNLVPIAGLENDLRHRLGYAPVVYRAIREAAVRLGARDQHLLRTTARGDRERRNSGNP